MTDNSSAFIDGLDRRGGSDALLYEMRAASPRISKILSVLWGAENTYRATRRSIATTTRYGTNQNDACLFQ